VKIRQIIGTTLMVIGLIPAFVWLGIMTYLLWLGPRAGWLSDEFLHLEGISFAWCAGMFLGIGVAAAGDFIRVGKEEILNGERKS